jgi:hypothetical protein
MKTLKLVALYFFAYAFAKKIWEYDLASQVIDGVNGDGGIFLAQARTIKDLAFFNPTIFTAPYGFPQQFSYLFTDNFLIPGIIFSILTLFGLTEQLALNLIKITASILNGFVVCYIPDSGFSICTRSSSAAVLFCFPSGFNYFKKRVCFKAFFLGCLSQLKLLS